MTEQLYYENPYLTTFTAKVIKQQPYKDYYAVVLDRTAFYPEGGGQPTDLGFVNGVPIIEVIEEHGVLLHILPTPLDMEVLNGHPINCDLSWDRRFDHMQQHTGQHILSACFAQHLNGETNSFHLGKDSVSIEIGILDFDMSKAEEIENMANALIFQNLPITTYIADPSTLSELPLRKQPKVTENIRIVQIGSIDFSPCGGTHASTTGQVGMIKIKRWEKCKDCYRFEFVCGYRALKDYQRKNSIVNSLGARLSVREHEVENAIFKLLSDYHLEQKQMSDFKQQLFKYEAKALLDEGQPIGSIHVVCKVFNDHTLNDAKAIAQFIIEQPSQIVLFVCKGQNAQVLLSRSDNVSYDMGQLLKALNPIIDGKGGGNAKSAQGGGKLECIDLFLESALKLIKEGSMLYD